MRAINPCGRPPKALTRGHDRYFLVRLRRRDYSLSDSFHQASVLETRSHFELSSCRNFVKQDTPGEG